MKAKGPGNAGLMDNEENQRQVFHRCPQPLEIAKARFPHFHRPGEAWKSGKPKAGFPLSHLSLLSLKTKSRKEAWRRIASLPPSGSFLY